MKLEQQQNECAINSVFYLDTQMKHKQIKIVNVNKETQRGVEKRMANLPYYRIHPNKKAEKLLKSVLSSIFLKAEEPKRSFGVTN